MKTIIALSRFGLGLIVAVSLAAYSDIAGAATVVNARGTIEPLEVVDVSAGVSGMIQKFGTDPENDNKSVDVGTKVKKGTVLVQLDPSINKIGLSKAKAALDGAEAALRAANIQSDIAERELGRVKKQEADKMGSSSGVDKAKVAFDVAQSKVKDKTAAVDECKAALQLAQHNFDACTLRSPIDGVILVRRVDVGQNVEVNVSAPSQFLVGSMKNCQILATVNSPDINRVKKGQSVTYTVESFPNQKLIGKVSNIRTNDTTDMGMRSFTVVIDPGEKARELMPYSIANVEIDVGNLP